MCLILVAHRVRPDVPLVVLANRDEFLDRPTRPLAFWEEHSDWLAGRDLKEGGTWMGVSVAGRMAAVTNYREPGAYRPEANSRGDLVTGFLAASDKPAAYLDRIQPRADSYNGFNLIVWERGNLAYGSNRLDRGPVDLEPGIYGLSNELLDTPWPKVQKGKKMLAERLAGELPGPGEMLDLLSDGARAPDRELPSTGVTLEQERGLSSMFIRMDGYGTRSSSLLIVHADGVIDFHERTFNHDGEVMENNAYSFQIEP